MTDLTNYADGHDLDQFRATVNESLISNETASLIGDTFSTLSDPTRLRIIGLLTEVELCVGDLGLLLGMSQPAISHHLRILRNLRFVSTRKEGRHIFYSLTDQHIRDIYVQSLEHALHDQIQSHPV